MIYKNIMFHNVVEMQPQEDGSMRMLRIPSDLVSLLNPMVQENTAFTSNGVELRFKLISDEATIILKAMSGVEATVAYLFEGSLQGGWEASSRVIGATDTKLTFKKSDSTKQVKQISEMYHLPYAADVIRVVLPYCRCQFVDVIGEVAPPASEDLPKKTYLAYGSSITHGSLALGPVYTYPFAIAKKAGTDYLNLGFAGSAHLERAMAEYIHENKDWDFATIEMGINVITSIEDIEFEKRVSEFVEVLDQDDRPIFFTDIFTNIMDIDDMAPKQERFRKIVEKYASRKHVYTPGNVLMTSVQNVSADFVHPNVDGIREIADHWWEVIRSHIEL